MAPADPQPGPAKANRLLARLATTERPCSLRLLPTAEIGKRLGGGPPALHALLSALRGDGWSASAQRP